MLFGADTPVSNNWRIGLLGGYDHSTFDVDQRSSSGSSDDYHLGMYGGTQLGAVNVRLGASYTWHDIDTQRSVAFSNFSDQLSAGYSAATGQVFGEVGYQLAVGPALVEPFVNLAYTNQHVDGFSERGNAAALTGQGDSVNRGFSTLGARASSDFALGKIQLTASGTLGWRHAYGNSTSATALAFSGSTPFIVSGVPIARDTAVVQAGIGAAATHNLLLSVFYTGQYGDGVTQQGAFGNFMWRF